MTEHTKKYQNIKIPEELEPMINQTIKKEQEERRRKSRNKRWIAVAAALAVFITPLNVSQAFADTMAEIPIIGSIARVFTFRDYMVESEELIAEVTIPEVAELNDQAFEDKVNAMIQEKVDHTLAEAQERAEEYKQAYLETGGTEEGYEERKIEAKVDYTVYAKNEDTLSFMLFSYDSVAAAYAEYSYFNLDVKNDREWTLSDLLGENNLASITEQVKEQMSEQGDIVFWDEVNEPDWKVREDIDFYINKDGRVVVVFDKYEIAAGAFGRLEYEIVK
jgi:hypothetical protein